MTQKIWVRLQKNAMNIALLSVGWILYYANIKIFFVLALLWVIARYFPMPKLFSSWLGRGFCALLFMMSILQVAGTLQFLAAPNSGYRTLSFVTLITTILILMIVPAPTKPRRFIIQNDIFALLLAAFFLLPFAPLAMGRHPIQNIAQIGTTQAVDGPHHYGLIAMVNAYEHFTYVGSYYPEGFHLAAGFMGNSVTKQQANFSWQTNAVIYFTQYLVLGTMLAYALYYLALRWLQLFRNKDDDISVRQKVTIVLCAGPTLALFYLLPFISEGFLNYYYVCTVLVVGLLVLSELRFSKAKKDAESVLVQDEQQRWSVSMYLLLLFGAASSWTLLMPPFLLILLLVMVPNSINLRQIFATWWSKKNWLIGLLMLLQLLPVYLQLKYLSSGSGEAVNYVGTLRQFHPLILLAGLVLIATIMYSQRISEVARKIMTHIFMPLFFFMGALIALQYFTLGEVRYYVLKCLLLLEMLIVMAAVSWLLYIFTERFTLKTKDILMLALLPLVAVLLLVGSIENPMKDLRDLFRNYSNDEKPQFLNQDDEIYMRLTKTDKINNFNSTIMHYDKEKKSFFAHMQVPLWSNMLQYGATIPDIHASNCFDVINHTITPTVETGKQKAELKKIVLHCANAARDRGQAFYVITDRDSAPYVSRLLGNKVKVVY